MVLLYVNTTTISILYVLGLLISIIQKMNNGSSAMITFMHVLFFFAFIIINIFTNSLQVLSSFFLRKENNGRFLLLFIAYYLLRIAMHLDLEITRLNLDNFTKGIIPGLILGFITFGQFELRTQLLARIPTWIIRTLNLLIIIITIITLIFISQYLFLLQRTDLFAISKNLIEMNAIPYQYIGDCMCILFIAIIVFSYNVNKYASIYSIQNKLQRTILVLVFALIMLPSMLILGSNKGSVLVILSVLAFVKHETSTDDYSNNNRPSSIYSILLLIFAAISFLIFFYFGNINIDMSTMRIFSYGDGLSNHASIFSRIDVINSTGAEQLFVNPVFGDIGAEYTVGRPGEYIHSLISVQSHLGFVGSTLLLLFIIGSLRKNQNLSKRKNNIFRIFIIPIFFMSIIAAHFSWILSWFLFGGLIATESYNHK